MEEYICKGFHICRQPVGVQWGDYTLVEANVDWVPGLGNADANGDRS